MKLVGFKIDGIQKIGHLDNGVINEIDSSITEVLASNADSLESTGKCEFDEVIITPPIYPSKIVCVGLNYKDHAKELDMDLPEEPVIFIKPSTAVIGHSDPIIYPESSEQVDYEAELGIVISRQAHHVRSVDASEFIGGYTVVNDVTARDKQRKDIQWTRAKSYDTFAPLGPCIETDLDPMNKNISLRLNDDLKQFSNTKNMIFDVYELVEFISSIMTLNAGDVISTGTPPGVGSMNIGDRVEAEVEGIGILKNVLKKDEK